MAISYNAADYIEKDKIINACNKIDEIAKSYYNMGKKCKMQLVNLQKMFYQ